VTCKTKVTTSKANSPTKGQEPTEDILELEEDEAEDEVEFIVRQSRFNIHLRIRMAVSI